MKALIVAIILSLLATGSAQAGKEHDLAKILALITIGAIIIDQVHHDELKCKFVRQQEWIWIPEKQRYAPLYTRHCNY